MRCPKPNPDSSHRGSAIVVVLALVTLAAFLLSQFIERATTEMLVEARARHADRLRADARSALEASLAVLADFQAVDDGLFAPAQGWGEPLAGLEREPRPGTTVEVRVEDESGRLSLPQLDARELSRLGRQLGLEESRAAALADALLTWTRRDHTATHLENSPRNYEFEELPHRPPGRPLESFGELAAVAVAREVFFTPEGRPTPLLEEFEQAVSLYDFPATNVNTAQPEALALAGVDAAQVARLLARQAEAADGPDEPAGYFRSMAEAQTFLGPGVALAGFDARARCLRIAVRVQEGATVFLLTAIVAPAAGTDATGGDQAAPAGEGPGDGDLHYPFKLLALQEGVELNAAPHHGDPS